MKEKFLNDFSVDYVNFEYGCNTYIYGIFFPENSYHSVMFIVNKFQLVNYAIVMDSDTTGLYLNDDSFHE